MKVYAKQNDTLDEVIFRHLGHSSGLLEEALLINPTLANMPILPIGTEVKLPTIQKQAISKETIQLWE